jgi:hypothetical protein
MPKHQPNPVLERTWRDRIALWRVSSLSVRAFCRQQRLNENSFYFWRRELLRRDQTAANTPAFVPVHLFAPTPSPPPAPAAPLELLTSAGTLRIPPGCDLALLRCVLALLGERPC